MVTSQVLKRGQVSRVAALTLCIASVAARPAAADVITDWNNTTVVIGGPQIQRTWTMVHVAMFDAVNAIQGTYTPYSTGLPTAPAGVSPVAAAAGAAHGVLVRLFPARAVDLAAALASSTAGVPNGAAKTDGIAFGDAVAQLVYQRRLGDGILDAGPLYTSTNEPGDYQLTPGAPPQPVNTNVANWRPFAMTHTSQFRPSGPRPLNAAAYAQDLDETRRYGAALGSERTADQDIVARWALEQGTFQGNRIARTEAANDGRSLIEHARLFAHLNLAIADAITAVFDAKYAYRFWRPVTAIRNADLDDNRHTDVDPTWAPFLTTPPHPEYPAAHGAVSGAVARVLKQYFGPQYAFVGTSTGVPGVSRRFESFDAWAEDAALARIFGGMHLRYSLEVGLRQGHQVANWVLERWLTPRQ